MQEKRRCKRTNADLKLTISSLFEQGNAHINDYDTPIRIVNISKDGIGFISSSILPLNFYFNVNLQKEDTSELFTVVKIIRCEPISSSEYEYGCQFMGRSEELDHLLDEI